MLVIGLTGGIGSGKSTVADLFAALGAPVIDADVIARDITLPNGPAFAPIIAHFGTDILQQNGTLNRAALRDLIFTHPQERQWLEALLHPLIRDSIKRQLDNINAAYCLLVIPLLVETGAYPFINRILVVDAPEALQTERVMTRDQASEAQIKSIIQTQVSREARLSKANDVITNNSTLENLTEQVAALHKKYLNIK